MAGSATGWLYCRFYAGTPAFYQKWFGPAVMFASGHGYVNPDTTRADRIRRFLDLETDRLGRDDVPADTPTVPLGGDQRVHRYLLLAVGLWWRLAGISWSQVAAVNAVLYGLATASLYAIFRLGVRPPLATLGALVLASSAVQLGNLVHLRDYAKTPFVLASVWIMGTVVARSMSRRGLLGHAALGGVTLGIGAGFRIDVIALVPIFALALVAFHADRPWRRVGDKLLALALFLAVFVVSAAPILLDTSTGSNVAHVVILGLMEPFDPALRIDGSIYSFGPHYNDSYVGSVVGSYAERRHDVRAILSPYTLSRIYGQMGLGYLLTLSGQFPADLFTRLLASVAGILELPFQAGGSYQLVARVPFEGTLARAHQALQVFAGLGVPLAVVLVVGLAARRLTYGLWAAFLAASLCGLSALQFDPRHHFHLQFLSVFSLLVVVERLVRAARPGHGWRRVPAAAAGLGRSLRTAGLAHPALRAAGRGAFMSLLIVVTTLAPLWALRRYQERDLRRLFGTYLSAETQDVRPTFHRDAPGRVSVTWPADQGRAFASGQYPTDYYVVEVANDGPPALGAIGLRYAASSPHYDLSRTMLLPFSHGTTRIFFPVYTVPEERRFLGLEIGEDLRARLRGVSRVARLDDKPLLLDLTLGPDWQRQRLFQRSRAWERPDASGPTVYAAFRPGSASAHGWIESPAPGALGLGGLETAWSDQAMVKADGPRLVVNGRAKGPGYYLVQFKPRALASGTLLVARGRLERGGLAIGLLEDGTTWHNQLKIDRPGDFVAAVEVGKAGSFAAVVSNALSSPWHAENRFIISSIGFLDAHGPR